MIKVYVCHAAPIHSYNTLLASLLTRMQPWDFFLPRNFSYPANFPVGSRLCIPFSTPGSIPIQLSIFTFSSFDHILKGLISTILWKPERVSLLYQPSSSI